MTREIPLTKGRVALVDDADFEWLSAFKWFFDGNYAARWNGALKRNERMHRVIRGPASYRHVDHANRDRLDNRRENLRECWIWQNRANTPRPTSYGYRGLSPVRGGKWRATICVAGRRIYDRASYRDPADAARAYDRLAREHHGEFAILNFAQERSFTTVDRASVEVNQDLFDG